MDCRVYDFNGNIVQDTQNLSFAYNGDDKQTVGWDLTIPTNSGNPDANVIGRYFYDGEGARVKKITNTGTTFSFTTDSAHWLRFRGFDPILLILQRKLYMS